MNSAKYNKQLSERSQNVRIMKHSPVSYALRLNIIFIIGAFRELVDINLLGAMGPPGGGRNPVTPRLLRHFNFLTFTEMEDSSKFTIFSTILNGWLGACVYHCNLRLAFALVFKTYS